jgi:integrase
MPVVRNSRTRIESSGTAEAPILALPESEQAFWALALFAGVRRGEPRGLQVDEIDFDAGLVHVRRGRDIPMIGELRRLSRKLQTAGTAPSCSWAAPRRTRSTGRRFACGR